MGDYNRTTRECSFGQMRPELVSAIREYAEKHEMGSVEAEIAICCETTSEKKRKGLFASRGADPDPVHYTGVLLTPTWLIWARSGAKSGTTVVSARLKEIEIQDFASKLIDDTGLEVFGFVGDTPERGHAFIGLGSESGAQKMREMVREAVAKAHQ